LGSLARQSEPATVVVVDNGSSDDSVALVRARHPDVALLVLGENRGFAGGVNHGIRHALERGAETVALFNNDAVPDEHWHARLVASLAADDRVGVVTSKILDVAGERFDSAGDFYSVWGFPYPRGRDERDEGQYDERVEVPFGCGGASVYRAAMLAEVG